MSSTPSFSIITPVYNAGQYLPDTIASVLSQSFSDYEWIVCDDGSTDASYNLLQKHPELSSHRMKLLHQDNAGVSAARNACLDVATGKYLLFLDADDRLAPNALEVIYREMENSGSNLGIFGWFIHQSDDLFSYRFEEKEKNADFEAIYEMILKDPYLCGGGYPWNKVWRRGALAFPPFRRDLHHFEDKLWTLQCLDLLKDRRITFIDEPLYHYYIYEASLSHNMTAEGFLQLAQYTLDSLEAMRSYVETVHPEAVSAVNELTQEKLATIREVLGDI
ncbi:MAG: glycosyltransferase [Lachnospiraceae bacterium]|nr:glycosyltransferase [Lachnospiraceae bacterium]